jgi:hypothetical protein
VPDLDALLDAMLLGIEELADLAGHPRDGERALDAARTRRRAGTR